jgi:dihydroorotate dehydrogenase (NAD+) catalytic subunit
MSTDLAGIALPSPLLTASGCAAAGKELDAFMDITQIGAVVTKSIMLKPRAGRATPRMSETPSGMLNSIGLQGPGIESFIENDLSWLAQRGARTIVSIAGESVDEYSRLASKLRNVGGFEAIEVNISCPNVADRGQVFACRSESAAQVIQAVRRNSDSRTPIFAKLSPDVTDIVEIADSVIRAGATGVSLINTLLGMVIDTRSMRPALAGVTGGLSGPAVRPVAVRCVWQVRHAFPDVPIIGMGGILDSARFKYYLSEAMNVPASDLQGTVVGGHGDTTMIPLTRLATYQSTPVSNYLSAEKLAEVKAATMVGGATLTGLIGTSAWYAPGAAGAALTASIVRDQKKVFPCSVYLEGEYGESDICMGVPVVIGANGWESIVDYQLNAEEAAEFAKSATAVRAMNSVLDSL